MDLHVAKAPSRSSLYDDYNIIQKEPIGKSYLIDDNISKPVLKNFIAK